MIRQIRGLPQKITMNHPTNRRDFLTSASAATLGALAAHAQRYVRPVEVKEDLPVGTLIDELLEENHLLTAEHTLDHWQSELYLPGAMVDRTNWDQWEMQGSKDLRARAHEMIDEKLDDHDTEPLDPALDAAARGIFAAAVDEGVELPPIEG